MPILEMFRVNTFIGVAWCACLATIVWCLILLPALARGPERFLVGFIGLIAVYQGLRLLKDAGVWKPSGAGSWEDVATLVVCSLYLVALLVVQVFGAEHSRTKVRLRLAEAETPLPAEGRSRRKRLESAKAGGEARAQP